MDEHVVSVGQLDLAKLGLEIWRLGQRLGAGRADRLEDSVRRLTEAFEAVGGRLEDRTGEAFVDGTTAEILHQPDGVVPGSDRLVWAETVRPGVYINGHCAVVPQVILELEQGDNESGAPTTHD